ncbi:uncharacterized protein LOC133286724 [Gastrolobium bilobum]|uniref:uncharacterized protein LOC133286724 n=1 Tax=Gastrolobium bilobum TaxID=150636 RepID=UPI002AB0326A|nr:uncharacterized protein LOC133286724 [Gastrolobium bilobum]
MKEIFDLDARDVTNLQDLHLEALPKLEHVWKRNEDQGRIPNLEKLRKLSVHYCESLEYIFPFSEVMCLPSLETLVVRMCFKLREIVTKGRSSKPSFVFPKLTTIKFSALRRLMSFYPGDYEVSCPELSDLSIERCFRLKPFRKDTANAQTVLFRNEVINNLKSMQIESWHANYMGKANYRRNKLEELCLSRLVNTEILYSFLDSNPNLQSLSLIACSFKEVVPPSRSPGIQNLLGLVPKLKSLKLIDLPKLVEIGFERDIVLLEKIESLVLETCPCLESIISSSVSFTHLTNLEVVNCNGLKYLMPPLTAKSLIHLTTIKVIKCESLKEIVSEQGSEEDGNKDDNIFFRQLKALELVSLKSIESFCSSKSYVFEFPLLENLVVSACPKMKNFSEEVKCTSILQKIYVVHEQQKRCSWHGNLKHTIQKVSEEKKYFEGMEEMSYSEYLELQQAAWHVGVGLQKNWFYSLKTLKLVKCDDIQPYAIPSYILPYLSNLNELEVRDCKKVKVIFEMNDSEIMEAGSQLKKLTLEKLSELKQVWNMHHQGILRRFHENLQQVSVSYCNNLKTLFPLALAKNLKKLEELKIRSCIKLPEIVKKEKTPTEKFVFPCLTMLNLFHLPELSCFYHKTLTLECPALNHLSVKDCGKLELFQSVHPEDEGESSSVSNNRGFLFSDIKAISNLEKLKLCGKRTLELLRSRSTEALIYLNELEVGFDENEPPTFPLEILHKAPDLERMQFSNCNIVEEFLTPDPEIVEHGMLGHLIMLQLYRVSNLHSIGSEKSSWLNTIRDRLNKLYVSDCPHLTEIVHSAVSFSNLKELFIWRCHELKYLFPPATAEKLRNLEVMRVLECKSIKVVVAKEGDQTTSGSIKFERLCSIELNSLSSLECFYSGNDTLVLPSLIVVNIRQCLKMESFSHGSTNAESFRGIFSSVLHEELVLHEDLNGSVKRVLLQRDHLVLGDSPLLEKIWCKLEPDVPHWYFCNLKSLVVEGCDFLSNAILPSHLLRSLSNLEELQVRNCNSVEAIFGAMVNMTPASDPLSFGLKKLILKQLQSLKDIWDKDTQGRLSFPFLEEVLVDGCNSIEYLFPASVAKDTLQKLDVKSCEGLVLISAKDKATTEEAEKELCIFPSLISLRLRDLPNLQQIYPGMHILECPMLKELDVIRCQMLKFFVTNSQTDSHPESQDSSPTDEEQAFVSLQKVTPNLEKLWRTKEDAAMIEQRKLHVDLQRLDSLRLEGFHDESDEFPFVFCSKVPFPSIKKLWVVDSAFKEIFPITKILSRLKGLQHENVIV